MLQTIVQGSSFEPPGCCTAVCRGGAVIMPLPWLEPIDIILLLLPLVSSYVEGRHAKSIQ